MALSHKDRIQFAFKKPQTEIQKCSPFSFIFFSIIYGNAKRLMTKKVKKTRKFRQV